MKQFLGKAWAGVRGRFGQAPPTDAIVPNDELRLELGVKPGQKVCLFHAPKYLLPLFLAGDLKLTLDWVESDSDVIMYWLQPQDDAVNIMTNLERMIKRGGRVWLILSQKEGTRKQGAPERGDSLRRAVPEMTSLVDSKTISFGEGEYGILFVPRKVAREKKGTGDSA